MSESLISRRAVLAGLGATAVMAGCSSTAGTPTGTPAPSGGPAKLSGSINVWGGVPPEKGPQELCEAFMAANPGTTVTYTRFVNDDQGNLKLDTSLQGGADVDVFTTYAMPLLAKRVEAGLAMELTDRVAAVPELAPFKADAPAARNYIQDGKIYSVPAQSSPNMVLANLDMLNEAGIEIPKSWSFEEYREIAQKLSKPGKVYGSFNAPLVARTILGPDSMYTKDGKANFGDPAFRKELELQLAMQKEGSIVPMETVLAEKLATYAQGPFVQGRVAMINTQLYLVRYISDTKEFPHTFKTIALPQPGISATEDGWNNGAVGDHLSVSSKSKNPELAWALVEFWMKNAAKYMTKGGRMPSLQGEETPESLLAHLLGPDRDQLYDVDSFAKVLFGRDNKLIVDTKFKGAAEMVTLQNAMTQEVLLGTRTVDSWVSDLTKQADAAIASA